MATDRHNYLALRGPENGGEVQIVAYPNGTIHLNVSDDEDIEVGCVAINIEEAELIVQDLNNAIKAARGED